MANKVPKNSIKSNLANHSNENPQVLDENNDENDENKENYKIGTMFEEKNMPIIYSDYDINEGGDGVGYRSPCVSLQPYQGSTSPAGQGRSVREFEEQMANLRKENFNLKLRLYFIEESIPGYKQANTSSEDTLMKQIIDSKVEMEMLRKEIQEKQDILKEAAQAMNQMEKIQKETEIKYQHIIEDLNQKIQFLEMERDMEKSNLNGSAFVGEYMEPTNMTDNLNTLQKIHEMEGLLKQSDEKRVDFQQQIYSLEEILSKRDEAIKEYEEKVKELVFQNAELIETIDNKDKEIANNERFIRGLRSKNIDLKADNENLMSALNHTQDNFCKEISNLKTYERQMREQQDVLTRMQSTISIKTENTARLLERIQDYEKMVNKMNIERNIVKRENRFFRTIINKLQTNSMNNECYAFAKEEIYQKYANVQMESGRSSNKKYASAKHVKDTKSKKDSCSQQTQAATKASTSQAGNSSGYKLKQKFCVNICNNACNNHVVPNTCKTCYSCMRRELNADLNGMDYLNNCDLNLNPTYEPEEIPIRYTISDNSLFNNNNNDCCAQLTRSNSSENSLTTTFSSSLLCGQNDVLSSCTSMRKWGETSDIFLKDFLPQEQQPKTNQKNFGKFTSVDGIRYVYSKFGKFP